jgi:hypothetical protein
MPDGVPHREELAERVMRRIDRNDLDARCARYELLRSRQRENDELVHGVDLDEPAEESADVGPDAVVGDLSPVDGDPHLSASPKRGRGARS